MTNYIPKRWCEIVYVPGITEYKKHLCGRCLDSESVKEIWRILLDEETNSTEDV